MLDFSFAELALVAVVALLVVDPKDVPQMLRSAMKWFGELRSVTDEVKGTVKSLMDEASVTKITDEIEGDLHEFTTMPSGQKYIEDEQGKLQPVYDISDFIKKDEQIITTSSKRETGDDTAPPVSGKAGGKA